MYYTDIKVVCLFKLLHFILTFHLKQTYFLAIPFPLLLLKREAASQILLVEFFSSSGKAEESDEGSY